MELEVPGVEEVLDGGLLELLGTFELEGVVELVCDEDVAVLVGLMGAVDDVLEGVLELDEGITDAVVEEEDGVEAVVVDDDGVETVVVEDDD